MDVLGITFEQEIVKAARAAAYVRQEGQRLAHYGPPQAPRWSFLISLG